MDFSQNFTKKEEYQDFLKTRIDSLVLPDEINVLLQQKNIRTVSGLTNKSASEAIRELGLTRSDLDLIKNSVNKLISDMHSRAEKKELALFTNNERTSGFNDATRDRISYNLGLMDGDGIISFFADHFGVQKHILIGPGRDKETVEMRDKMIYVLREYGNMSFPAIARLIGNRDHSTIMHSFRKITSEQKKQIEQSLAPDVISSLKELPKIKEVFDTVPVPKYIEISERDLALLNLFRQGLSFRKIGKSIDVTGERARQIILRTLERQSSNESLSTGVTIDIKALFKEEKLIREQIVKKSKPIKQTPEKLYVRKYLWSYHYPACTSCGRDTVHHFQRGLCEECGNKSITGSAREQIIKEHNDRCDACAISRKESQEKYGRDFYLSRKNKTVLCRGCFLESTGKVLGVTRKNKWKKFYN